MAAAPAILGHRLGGRRRGGHNGPRGGGPVARRRDDGHSEAGRPGSLEDLILGAAEELERSAMAECPVCGAPELRPHGCGACGSVLR